MSSRFIPRDKLATAVLWQMGALNASSQEASSRPRNGLVDDAAEREQADAAINSARDEGFRHGIQVGFAKGIAAGEANAKTANAQFDLIMAGLQDAITALDETVARDLVQLAMTLSKQIVTTHLTNNPDNIVPAVRKAFNEIIAIAQHPRLTLNPADAEIIRRDMAEELATHNCRIACDESMVRGGVRIDDANFELDASIETRWKRIVATLGIENDWLA